ncbi:MAG: rane protein of unknown function [Candidatus Saccharibacteria bacterium]|jgi:hypothetical protein|nr:rane protein of unknown function [Candidatus Saccharibacteria bacterium]
MKRRIFGIFLTLFASVSFTLAAPQLAYAAPETDGTAETSPTCDAGSVFTWMVCDFVKTLVGVVDWIREEIILPFLEERPLDKNTKEVEPVYEIWEGFRNVASLFLILVFFFVIFGTALGWDNYSIKKILPRLVAGAVLVPFSWWICVIVIDIGNILGQGLLSLTTNFIDPANIDFSSSMSKLFLAGGVGLGVAGAAAAITGVSLGLVISMVIAFAAVLVTLIFRKILITLMVILSPFAFMLWILPNTSKWFSEWWQNFFKLVMMYPIIMLLFEAGRIFSVAAGATAGNGLEEAAIPLLQVAGLIVPLFAVPMAFAWAGKGMKLGQAAIGKAAGAMDKRYGKDSDKAKLRAEQRVQKNADRFNDKNSNPLGIKALGSVKRGIALKRSGLGGFFGGVTAGNIKDAQGNVIGKRRIPGISNNAATKQRINAASAKYQSERAQSDAADQQRLNDSRTSHERVHDATAAQVDKLHAARVAEAMTAFKNAEGVSIKDIPLGGAGRKELQDIAAGALERGDKATLEAAVTRLSQSGGGFDAAQELAQGRVGKIQNADGSIDYVGGNGTSVKYVDKEGFALTSKNGPRASSEHEVATENALLGGTWGENVADEHKDMWYRATKGASGMDANKPIIAASSDMSAADIAKQPHGQIKRLAAFYNQAARSGDPEIVKAAHDGAADFAQAVSSAHENKNLRGQITTEAKRQLAEAGQVNMPGQHLVAPVVAKDFAADAAAAPAPTVTPVATRTATAIVEATGHDVAHVADINQQINQQIELSSENRSELHENIQNRVMQAGRLTGQDLADLGVGRPADYTPPVPSGVSRKMAEQFQGNIDAISDAARHYQQATPIDHPTRPDYNYQQAVQEAYLQERPLPPPPPPRPQQPDTP